MLNRQKRHYDRRLGLFERFYPMAISAHCQHQQCLRDRPTGCGDAFVAGLIPTLMQTFDTLGSVRWEQKINAIVRAGIQQAGLCLTSAALKPTDVANLGLSSACPEPFTD